MHDVLATYLNAHVLKLRWWKYLVIIDLKFLPSYIKVSLPLFEMNDHASKLIKDVFLLILNYVTYDSRY